MHFEIETAIYIFRLINFIKFWMNKNILTFLQMTGLSTAMIVWIGQRFIKKIMFKKLYFVLCRKGSQTEFAEKPIQKRINPH